MLFGGAETWFVANSNSLGNLCSDSRVADTSVLVLVTSLTSYDYLQDGIILQPGYN